MTEISDLLRVVFTYFSEIICPICHVKVQEHSPESVTKKLLELADGEQVTFLAPLTRWEKVKPAELKEQLQTQGFTRVRKQKEYIRLDDIKNDQLKSCDVVIDRVRIHKDEFRRLAEAAALGLKVGKEQLLVATPEKDLRFVSYLGCPVCERKFTPQSLALFSFNHPYGACHGCQGFGYEGSIDWEKVFPDLQSSLKDQGVIPWNFGQHVQCYKEAVAAAKNIGLSSSKLFDEYTEKEWQWVKFGDGKKFGGVKAYFDWLETQRHKAHYRIHTARFRKYVICTKCHGGRLNQDALACRVADLNFAEVSEKNIWEFSRWLESISQANTARFGESRLDQGVMGIKEALDELASRVTYLKKIGLGYLAIDRQTKTLSGGEQQRINMARCLGSALTSTMYCLDEPTSGLHARDSQNLLEVLYELRDQGNTVVVVEHEKGVIDGADYLVEIGPESGHKGGDLMYAGYPSAVAKRPTIVFKAASQKRVFTDWIELKGAKTHNLKNVSVKFPVGGLSVVCGVSGSGKTSLIQHTFYPLVAKQLNSPIEGYVDEALADTVGPLKAIKKHSQIIHVSQTSLGRSSRSNIATYLGIFDEIRKALADTPEAQKLRLLPGHFSFNTSGGRCENCKGLGTIVEDLSFLGEMEVNCPVCDGKRFKDKILQVEYRGKNLSQILLMTVAEVAELFYDVPAVQRSLKGVIDMGLGYVTVGQNTSSFSGGEAQRLKLLRLLNKTSSAQPSILIFDEPTTGLSDKDVVRLLAQLRALNADGHTVIVVEHHLGMIKSCDWLVEVGPDAADRGGEIVYQGTPDDIKQVAASATAKFIN